MMNIAINTQTGLYGASTGNDNFIFACFSRLAKKFGQHQFIYIFDHPYDKQLISSANITAVVTAPRSASPLLWPYWYNYKLPAILKKLKADVFVSADGICCLRTPVPQCLVLQDISFLDSPGFVKKNHRRFLKKFTPHYMAKAKRIGALTAYSKKIITDQYKVDEKKISILDPGTNLLFIPIAASIKESVKDQYAEGSEYFLFAGDIASRSNLVNLLKAFSFFKKRQKSNMQLLIAGTGIEKDNDFITGLKTYRYRNEVKLLTGLTTQELARVTATAYAFVYPVLSGGFPGMLPQAMLCEVPVITSNTGELPEICADAALYVSPENFNDIAEKMMQVFKDEDTRNEMIRKGKVQAKKFGWDQTADQLWELVTGSIEPETT
jgi:glycosyltransferase involved in cell wall biosynthesis